MSNNSNEFQDWLTKNFQFITLGMLVLCIFLIVCQQVQISKLNAAIQNIDECDLSEIESKLDDVESNLSSEIEKVRRTVILYGN